FCAYIPASSTHTRRMVPKIFIYSSDERLVSLKWVAALPIQSLEDVLNFQISEQSPVNCLLIRQIGSDLLKNAPITVPPGGVCATLHDSKATSGTSCKSLLPNMFAS